MKVKGRFESFMAKILEINSCKEWPRKNYICKVRKS
jgi:hypothetical protein